MFNEEDIVIKDTSFDNVIKVFEKNIQDNYNNYKNCSDAAESKLYLDAIEDTLNNKDITGKDAEKLLDSIGITVNKNTVPNETKSPFVTSGIRIGTAAVTTRGFDEEDMKEVAALINDAIENKDENLSSLKNRVKALCSKHPLY